MLRSEIIDLSMLANLIERSKHQRTGLDGLLTMYEINLDGHKAIATIAGGEDAVLCCDELDYPHVMNAIRQPLPHLRLVC